MSGLTDGVMSCAAKVLMLPQLSSVSKSAPAHGYLCAAVLKGGQEAAMLLGLCQITLRRAVTLCYRLSAQRNVLLQQIYVYKRYRPPPAGVNSDSEASGGSAHKPENVTTVSSSSRKRADKEATGSGSAPAQIRVGMEDSLETAAGGENAALRALVQKLPDLSYMLSDSLILPPRTR